MTRDEILSCVQALSQGEFELDSARTHPDARLEEDLDLDSIDLVALVMGLEQETGLLLREERLGHLRTIQGVVGFAFALQSPLASTSRPV